MKGEKKEGQIRQSIKTISPKVPPRSDHKLINSRRKPIITPRMSERLNVNLIKTLSQLPSNNVPSEAKSLVRSQPIVLKVKSV